jgi:hypothetical protein
MKSKWENPVGKDYAKFRGGGENTIERNTKFYGLI